MKFSGIIGFIHSRSIIIIWVIPYLLGLFNVPIRPVMFTVCSFVMIISLTDFFINKRKNDTTYLLLLISLIICIAGIFFHLKHFYFSRTLITLSMACAIAGSLFYGLKQKISPDKSILVISYLLLTGIYFFGYQCWYFAYDFRHPNSVNSRSEKTLLFLEENKSVLLNPSGNDKAKDVKISLIGFFENCRSRDDMDSLTEAKKLQYLVMNKLDSNTSFNLSEYNEMDSFIVHYQPGKKY